MRQTVPWPSHPPPAQNGAPWTFTASTETAGYADYAGYFFRTIKCRAAFTFHISTMLWGSRLGFHGRGWCAGVQSGLPVTLAHCCCCNCCFCFYYYCCCCCCCCCVAPRRVSPPTKGVVLPTQAEDRPLAPRPCEFSGRHLPEQQAISRPAHRKPSRG